MGDAPAKRATSPKAKAVLWGSGIGFTVTFVFVMVIFDTYFPNSDTGPMSDGKFLLQFGLLFGGLPLGAAIGALIGWLVFEELNKA